MARVMKVDDDQGVLIGLMSIARRVKLLQASAVARCASNEEQLSKKAARLSQKRLKMSMSAQTQ